MQIYKSLLVRFSQDRLNLRITSQYKDFSYQKALKQRQHSMEQWWKVKSDESDKSAK